MSDPSSTALPVTLESLEKIIIHHGQLFEEVFKRFDKMDQERREDREQRDEERRKDIEEREKEKQERKEEKRKKQEKKDEEKQQREDDIRKLEEEKAQMWQILDDGEYIKFFSRLVWTHKGRVCYYYSTNHVKSE